MAKVIGFVFGFLGMMLLMACLNAILVKIAWAYSISSIFGVRELDLIEAFALTILVHSLVGKGLSIKAKGNV